MQRYILPDTCFEKNKVIIQGSDARHIRKVMRMAPGDEIICCNSRQEVFLCKLKELTPETVEAIVTQRLMDDTELPIRVTIAQGLPKADKFDTIVQKGTELGATAFIPFQAERSISKWEGAEKIKRKQERLFKIAKEAAEQSHRTLVPKIFSPMTLDDLIDAGQKYDHQFVAYEEEAKNGRFRGLPALFQRAVPGDSILAVIGPEGGLSNHEIERFESAGFHCSGLGKRILRTETASLYLLSAISYFFELENEVK
ncbi:16S rRNA (uracil(1498)-N(3))-methyltransferase [Camelliibacillus cellulosilyticus]